MSSEMIREQIHAIQDYIVYQPTSSLLIKPLSQLWVDRTVIRKVMNDTLDDREYKRPESDNDLPDGYERTTENGAAIQRNGIILCMPIAEMPDNLKGLQVGDIVSFSNQNAVQFELFKDSLLVPTHGIIAKYTGDPSKLIGSDKVEGEIEEIKL